MTLYETFDDTCDELSIEDPFIPIGESCLIENNGTNNYYYSNDNQNYTELRKNALEKAKKLFYQVDSNNSENNDCRKKKVIEFMIKNIKELNKIHSNKNEKMDNLENSIKRKQIQSDANKDLILKNENYDLIEHSRIEHTNNKLTLNKKQMKIYLILICVFLILQFILLLVI